MVCSPTEQSLPDKSGRRGRKSKRKVTSSKSGSKTRMKTLIGNAKTQIKHARHMGADVDSSSELLKDAEKALQEGDFRKMRGLVQTAKAEAAEAKRYFRAERMIRNILPLVDYADEIGADISEPLQFLKKAQESLQDRNFGLVSQNVKNVRESVRRTKKRKKSSEILDRMRSIISKSQDMHLDVTRAVEYLLKAEGAYSEEKHAEVQKLFQRMKKAITEAKLKKKMEDKLQSVQLDLEELKTLGVDVSLGEEILAKARRAMEEGKYAKMQNLIQRNRRWIARVRKKRETEVLVDAVGTLVDKASQGREGFLDAKELLKSFKEAILTEKVSDLQKIVREDIDRIEDEDRRKRSTRRFLRLKNLVRDVEEYGGDTTKLEVIIQEVRRAFDGEDIGKAEDLMERIERSESVLRLSKKRAEYLLGKAKSSLSHAKNMDLDVGDAEELMILAENLLSEENFLESMEKAREAHQIAEKRTPEEAIAKRREIEKRLATARSMLDEARRASIDVSDADKSLEEAERAMDDGRLSEAEGLVTEVEILGEELSTSLESASERFISAIRVALDKIEEAGIPLPQVEGMYSAAETYHSDGKFQAAIEIARMAHSLLNESEKSIEHSAKESMDFIKSSIQEAKDTGAHVGEAEMLLEDASEAIQERDYARYKLLVEKAEGSLKEAESIFLSNRALEELEEIQSLVESARKTGLGQLDEAEIVLRKAQEAYETKNYGIVSMLADTAREMLGESKKRKLIQEFVGKSRSINELIERAEEAGVEASDVKMLLKKAQESFGEDDYEAALRFVEQSERAAHTHIQKFLKERFPKVLVNLPAGAVQSGTWNKYIFELVNEGNIAAEDVRVNFKGDFEVKGLKRVPSLLPKERKKMEVGLKPRIDGQVPVDVSVSFKKPLDQTNFEVRKDSNINISRLGTYLVDDVFLVHIDGRLILHETREFREEVDDDIFSGMLTVMQEFVRDSFGARATHGLSRMDFGDNKVVIERGHFVYLATILTGEEPALLPLYMAEVVKEIEEEYRDVLDNWSGLLSELKGVDDIVRRLIFVSDDEEAEIGELEASMITSTLEMLRNAQSVGADISQAQDLLQKAKHLLEEQDYESAWKCVEEAADSASKSKARLRGQIENALSAAQSAVDEAREMGLEVGKAEALLKGAEKASEDFDVDEVESIVEKVNRVISAAKAQELESSISTELEKADEVLEKLRRLGVSVEEAEILAQEATKANLKEDFESAEKYLQMFKEMVSAAEKSAAMDAVSSRLSEFKFITQNAKELGLDVSAIEEKLRQAEEAASSGEDEALEESLKEIGKLLEEVRSLLSASEVDRYLESVRGMVERARSVGIKVTEAERILDDASQLDSKDVEKLRALVTNAERSASGLIAEYVSTRSPDIRLKLPSEGLQADVWNKYVFEIANEGNIAARNLDVDLSGEFEVKGLERIPHIDAKEKKEVEVGIKPVVEGDTTLDVKLYYQKYFDEERYRLDDLRTVSVESQGTYLVEDVFLIHRDGRLIAHETRKYREEIDEDVFSGMLSVVQDFVKDSFQSKDNVGLRRLDFGESKILMERGKYVSVATVLIGQEPTLLPLHVLEVIARVEEEFGEMLDGWTGLMSDLSGINELIRELIFVTDDREALSEGLESSLVTATFGVDGAHQIIEEARRIIETKDMNTAWDFISGLEGVVMPEDIGDEMAYPETTLSPEFLQELGELAESSEFRGHVTMISEIVHCVSQARRDLGLSDRMPIRFVAIKAYDDESANVISDFRRVLQDHLRAKDMLVVRPDEDWEGLDLEIIVNEDKIAQTYPQWSRKIRMLLKSQSPWKIKTGLDKGKYSLGIEGQEVSIDGGMVSYEVTIPEHIAEYEFEKGVLYIDKTQTEELFAEAVAGEIIEEINRTKEEAGIEDDSPVEIRICVGDELKKLLEDWIDEIITEVRCTSFKYRPSDWEGDDQSPNFALLVGEEEIRVYLKELAEVGS